ncbi:MAG: RHS repeat-associated core domain-containing protein [Planctomycetaceae bacterium]
MRECFRTGGRYLIQQFKTGNRLVRRGFRPTLVYLLIFSMLLPSPQLLFATGPGNADPKQKVGPGDSSCTCGEFLSLNSDHPNTSPIETTPAPILLRTGEVYESYDGGMVPSPTPGASRQARGARGTSSGTARRTAIWRGKGSLNVPISFNQTYTSNLVGSTKAGNKWFNAQIGSHLEQDGTDVILKTNAVAKATFTNPVSNVYTSPDSTSLTLEHVPLDDEFILTDTNKNVRYVFYDFDATPIYFRGRIKSRGTRQYKTQSLAGDEYTYNSSGQLIQITTAEPQSYDISFSYSGAGNLTNISVTASVDEPGGMTPVDVTFMTIQYTYWDSVNHSANVGTADDLVQVKTSMIDSNGSLSITKYVQYRYNADSRLTHVFEDASLWRMVDAMSGISTPDDLLAEANTFEGGSGHALVEYADRTFTYYTGDATTSSINTPFVTGEDLETKYGCAGTDETDMVATETIGGCSSCSGTTAVKKSYFYLDLNTTSTDANTVRRVVVEDTEDDDGNAVFRKIYGVNDTGQLLRQAITPDPVTATDFWCISQKLATSGKAHRVSEYRTAEAHDVDSNTDVAKFIDPTTSTNDADTLLNTGAIYAYSYNSDGLLTETKVKKGSSGTYYYESATDYNSDQEPTSIYYYPTKTTSKAGGEVITNSYTYWDGNNKEIKKVVTTYPTVDSGQNGSGVATTTEEYYDNLGRLTWTKDGEGYVNYFAYHGDTSNAAYVVVDIDPSSVSSEVSSGSLLKWLPYDESGADTNKPTRGSGLPTPLELTSKAEYDLLGRITKIEDNEGAEHYISYGNTRSIIFPNWDSTNSVTQTPMIVVERNQGGQMTEMYSVEAGYASITVDDTNADADTEDAPIAFSTDPSQDDYIRWSKQTYDDFNGRPIYADVYHNIPSSGDGTLDTNFFRSLVQYDDMGMVEYMIQVVKGSSAGDRVEQVTQYVRDELFRVVEVKSGVSGDSSANSHNMTDSYNTYPTLQTVSRIEYDYNGVGNNFPTKIKRYYGTGTNDYTGANLWWTYRGHLRGIEPFYMDGTTQTDMGLYAVRDIDWLGRTTVSSVYDSDPNWTLVLTADNYSNYATGYATNRIAKSAIYYDDLGRVYNTRNFKVLSDGTHSHFFSNEYYYNRNNQLAGYGFSRTNFGELAYDGAGRMYQMRDVQSIETTKYASGVYQYRDPQPNPSLSSMSGGDDVVLGLQHYAFDGTLLTEVHDFQSTHLDVDSGTNGIDLTNHDDYIRTSTFAWYDDVQRLTTVADYGSGDTGANSGVMKYTAIPTRPGTAPSASTSSILVGKMSYHSETGAVETVTDAAGHVSKGIFDDLGRILYSIENYANFNESTEANTGDSVDKSKDRVVKYGYGGVRLESLIALDADGDGSLTDNQETKFLFEDAISAGRKTTLIFPDSSDTTSSGTDQLEYGYNIDGSLDQYTNQLGTVFDLTYNDRRQLELVDVTTLGTNVDGAVRSIKRTFDDQWRVEKVTSYGSTGGTGTVRNEVQVAYNEYDQITNFYQSHEGAVNTSTSPSVDYAYDDNVGGTVFERLHRLKEMTYPDGRVVHYDYDTGTTNVNFYNRHSYPKYIRETNSTGNILAQYSYTPGGGTVVSDLPEPDLKLNYYDGTAGEYAGLDRYGRVKGQLWEGYNTTNDADEFDYTHDYNSNVTTRDIPTGIYATNNKDQAFSYDSLHRMKNFDEGTLSSGSISGTPTREQDITLDSIGNWVNQILKTSGSTDLDQTRTVNDANEISNITESTGPAWVTPAYDAAGNMTTIPKPAAPTGGYTATYDAFNRLVKLEDGANTVAEYEYDGLGQRIVKSVYVSGSKDWK